MRKRWWTAIIVAGVAVLAVAGAYGRKAWEAEWARRHPEAARIARYEKVFDAAWKTVDEKYYDPKFDHARWRRVRDVYRPRIRDAKSDGIFYVNILSQMMNQVGSSHVGVSMPVPVVSNAPSMGGGSSRPAKLTGCGGSFLTNDLGFDLAEIRRGRGAALLVADVRRGSNAERAGVAPNDLIRKLNIAWRRGDCPWAKFELQTASQAPRQVAFAIDDHPIRSATQRIDLPSGVRVLRFDRFDRESLTWLRINLPQGASRGLVLDLRHNGGGKIWVERKIASQFLPPKAVIGREIRKGHERTERTSETRWRFEGQLVVLVGPLSASAAEMTAAALRYHGRARLIGDETAGAVLVSQGYPLPDGGRVNVAIADALTPDGQRLEGVGLKPDQRVIQTLEAIRAGRDLPLEAAERALLDGR